MFAGYRILFYNSISVVISIIFCNFAVIFKTDKLLDEAYKKFLYYRPY